MSSDRETLMLKYQKAKVKLLEYDVPKENYPSFPLDYNDLSFHTIYVLSLYANSLIEDDEENRKKYRKHLRLCSEYYDAAFKSGEQKHYNLDFLLTGAMSYFFDEDYGSAMVLLKEIPNIEDEYGAKKSLTELLKWLMFGERLETKDRIIKSFFAYPGIELKGSFLDIVKEKRRKAYLDGNPTEAFFSNLLAGLIIIAMKNSATNMLADYSGLPQQVWKDYFQQRNSIKMIWPAQKLIGEMGMLRGQSGIVQLPTGVGKTKSIELIIRSMFLGNRGKVALIVAPLKSLCNEITDDMNKAFEKGVWINQFSELLEMDFELSSWDNNKKMIIICTPEKMQYILRHCDLFISRIDLFIFDEGHLFDDRSRGTLYELLFINIKQHILDRQQLVIMSAVLSNAEDIRKWFFNSKGVLAYNSKIKSTPKVVGFTSSSGKMHYYSDSFEQEDFFIPRAVDITKLKRIGRERNVREFPEKSSSRDMAIYFANKLCKNGGIAIYVSQKRSIPKYFERIKELKDRGYELINLRTKSDMNELLRLQKLIFRYYGEESIYSDISKMGILPHYSSLPSGLRMSVEYAFRKGKIYTVICTSTLSQGINIPIKYLILTSLNMAQNSLTVRNFQNLIGRTARSGVYTEGNIIISDSKIYDERKGKRGKFLWRDTEYMFDPNREEACSSAILSIVQNIDLTYKFSVDGSMVTEYICNNISKDWTASDLFADEKEYEEKDIISKLNSILQHYRNSVDSIENEILYVWRLEDGENTKSINMISQKICTNSLAYYLANDEEKKRLSKLFKAMATDIYSNIDRTNRYAFSMLSPPNIVLILDWISSCQLNNQEKTEDELIEQITGLYQSMYTGTDISYSICRNWIKGKSYVEISQTTSLDLFKIEKICNYNLSYQFCFLVGNVIDCLEESVNTEMFMLLQKKIKYGVDSVTAISICEKVFNDRMLAKDITNILDDKHISNDEIIGFIKMKKEKISDYLKDYPIFFQDKIKYLR